MSASNQPAADPLWSHNGRELFYRAGGAAWAVSVEASGERIAVGTPERLFDDVYDSFGETWDRTQDGLFVMTRLVGNQPREQPTLFLDWAKNIARSFE